MFYLVFPRQFTFKVQRLDDRRDAQLSWKKVEGAQGYTVYWGIAPDKLYQSWQVYDTNTHFMRCLDRDTSYYFTIEAYNEILATAISDNYYTTIDTKWARRSECACAAVCRNPHA